MGAVAVVVAVVIALVDVVADDFVVVPEEFVDGFFGDFGGRVDVEVVVEAEDALDFAGDGEDIVGDEHDGHALAEFSEGFVEGGLDALVDIGGGFVEEEELGFGDEGAGDEDALALAAGEVGEGFVGDVFEADFAEGV